MGWDPGPGETVPRAAVVWGLGAGRPSGGSPQLGPRQSPWRGQASNTWQSCFVCIGYALPCLAGFGLFVIKTAWIHEHKQVSVGEMAWQTPQRAVAFTFLGLGKRPALPPCRLPTVQTHTPAHNSRRFSCLLRLRFRKPSGTGGHQNPCWVGDQAELSPLWRWAPGHQREESLVQS